MPGSKEVRVLSLQASATVLIAEEETRNDALSHVTEQREYVSRGVRNDLGHHLVASIEHHSQALRTQDICSGVLGTKILAFWSMVFSV